ncbi:MAG TPA: hypothetical protein VLV78_02295 [Thermoanaerobaculia bacterium]|nr:hypothetical protein [Thermoanaerobaculia bacterium]
MAQRTPNPPSQEIALFDQHSITAPARWKIARRTRNSVEIFVPLAKPRKPPRTAPKNPKPIEAPIVSEAGMTIVTEGRRSHDDALARLANIASEQPVQPAFIVISGFPAIERRYRAPMPEVGETDVSGNRVTWFGTIAVAVGSTVLRFETMLAPDADPKLLDEAMAIPRTLRAPGGNDETATRDFEQIRSRIRLPNVPPSPAPAPGTPGTKPGGEPAKKPGNTLVQAGVGELEVTASNDGQHVVVAANSGWSFSDDSAGTFTSGGLTPCTYNFCDGDPSLAFGQSGNFYYSWIGFPSGDPSGHADGITDSVSVSATSGHSWVFGSDAVFCPTGGAACSIPDQEHIAADRHNAGAGGDRVYLVWRNFGGAFSIDIVCSSNSASTWTAPAVIDAGADFPRVTVGPDGSVYAAYRAGANMNVRRFTSCDAGLTPQPVVTVSAFTMVPCPVAGLDRCNSGNVLSSPTVAVDENDSTHVFYAFATSTVAGTNEDVMVFDSTDGGATFPRSVRANSAVAARRFMPWISASNGNGYVTWYDRRNAAAATNDLTRFFGARVWNKAGTLLASEVDVSQIDDAQCASGWPQPPRATTDSESCSTQPQLAGMCYNLATSAGSFARCDFSSGPACAAGETCNTGGGAPKYGDYNGSGAIAGRRFSAWSSATPPPGVVGAPAGINVYADGANLPSDYYVRDWTDTAAIFDPGVEPSTRPDFWARSDVWNQTAAVPAAPVSGWILGDPPIRTGSNNAFARVSRRFPASTSMPAESVTVHFLASDYGAGLPFVDIGTVSVPFNAGDTMSITPAVPWTVSATASIHICLAVEITGPGGTDDFIPPSLVGNSPGPADPLVIADNNKAQRNLQETIDTGVGFELISMIRRAEEVPGPMELKFRLPIPRSITGVIEEIGGHGARAELAREGRLNLGIMQPGEVRWVRLHVNGTPEGEPVLIDFFLGDDKQPGNGFTIRSRRAPLDAVGAQNLKEYMSVMDRLAEVERNPLAKKEADAARRLAPADAKSVDEQKYFAFLRDHARTMRNIITKFASQDDPTGLREAQTHLTKAISAKNRDDAALAHKELLERLDAGITMRVRANGARSDVLHNVRWQRTLFRKSADIVRESSRFIEEFGRRRVTADDFPKLLTSIDAALSSAVAGSSESVKRAFEALQKAERSGASVETLQKLHRRFLLEVQKAT